MSVGQKGGFVRAPRTPPGYAPEVYYIWTIIDDYVQKDNRKDYLLDRV